LVRLKGISDKLKAFLDTIAYSEGTAQIPGSEDGYRVIVGSTPKHPILLDSFKDHPRRVIKLSDKLSSTAAGRYQILARFFDAYKRLLNLPDFSPESQDKIAVQLIKECRAAWDIEDGRTAEAIGKCASRWASFPGDTNYDQHQNELSTLVSVFNISLKSYQK
jgi:muramidase (phage lysozyme)